MHRWQRLESRGIRYFANARANKVTTAADFTYTFNICNGLDEALRDAGHTRGFYWANQDCWETDIRDTDQGGDDVTYVDNTEPPPTRSVRTSATT